MSSLLFTTEKDRLLEHFRKDPVLFAYHTGDLDEFFFDDCQWAVCYSQSHMPRIDECVLIYHAGKLPTVLAFGLTDRIAGLLEELVDLLPDQFYCHFQSNLRDILLSQYHCEPFGTYVKMKLKSFTPDSGDGSKQPMRRLTPEDVGELLELYNAAYPGHYFHPRMLETGKYFGYFDNGLIVSAAGVHVYSPEYKMAVLGNVATLDDFRGNGLAKMLVSSLVDELVKEGCTVCLNVKADNASAIHVYESLGFVESHRYEEGLFRRG